MVLIKSRDNYYSGAPARSKGAPFLRKLGKPVVQSLNSPFLVLYRVEPRLEKRESRITYMHIRQFPPKMGEGPYMAALSDLRAPTDDEFKYATL